MIVKEKPQNLSNTQFKAFWDNKNCTHTEHKSVIKLFEELLIRKKII